MRLVTMERVINDELIDRMMRAMAIDIAAAIDRRMVEQMSHVVAYGAFPIYPPGANLLKARIEHIIKRMDVEYRESVDLE